MGRDRRTRTGARAPGVERQKPFERRCFSAQRPPAQNGEPTYAAGSAKDGGKPSDTWAVSHGQALSEKPAWKPYWGKPAVRNFREGNGTSASCEARYAPLLYPTNQVNRKDYLKAEVTMPFCN